MQLEVGRLCGGMELNRLSWALLQAKARRNQARAPLRTATNQSRLGGVGLPDQTVRGCAIFNFLASQAVEDMSFGLGLQSFAWQTPFSR